jgi:hypothetical protein
MNAVVQAKSLQERVGERIRDQIGDLLTDDDLKKLVEGALREAFFTPYTRKNEWGNVVESKTPLIVEIVRDLLKPQVEAAARAWMIANAADITKHIDDALGKGALAFLTGWLDNRLMNETEEFANRIQRALGVRP